MSESARAADPAGKKYTTVFEGVGNVVMEYKDSTYILYNPNGTVMLEGEYNIDKGVILLKDTKGENACPSEFIGEYEIDIIDKTLVMRLIIDDCNGRRMLASNTWKELDE